MAMFLPIAGGDTTTGAFMCSPLPVTSFALIETAGIEEAETDRLPGSVLRR